MKRLIALGVVFAAAAVGLTVWLLTRSDGPTSYTTEQAAVIAVCHADPAHVHLPASYGPYLAHPLTTFVVAWSKAHVFQASFAVLKMTHNRWVVQTCGAPAN